jgi:hypothetical protein
VGGVSIVVGKGWGYLNRGHHRPRRGGMQSWCCSVWLFALSFAQADDGYATG